jgi:large subunit ribosomal protein L10
MNRSEKEEIVEEIGTLIANTDNLYIADISGLTANQANEVRRFCDQEGVSLKVYKNTLIYKALLQQNVRHAEDIKDMLVGPSAIMTSEAVNGAAKTIQRLRKKYDRPLLKVAYVQESVYSGDDQLDTLTKIKSKDELVADVVALLQSPVKNVVGALQSGGHKIAGILKTLEERGEA